MRITNEADGVTDGETGSPLDRIDVFTARFYPGQIFHPRNCRPSDRPIIIPGGLHVLCIDRERTQGWLPRGVCSREVSSQVDRDEGRLRFGQ